MNPYKLLEDKMINEIGFAIFFTIIIILFFSAFGHAILQAKKMADEIK